MLHCNIEEAMRPPINVTESHARHALTFVKAAFPRWWEDRPMVARIALVILTAVLLAAHFLRAGNYPLVALCLAAPLLLLVRQRWSLVVLGGLAYAAGTTWLWAAWDLVDLRHALGQPWHRAAAILIGVAAVNVLTGALLHREAMRL